MGSKKPRQTLMSADEPERSLMMDDGPELNDLKEADALPDDMRSCLVGDLVVIINTRGAVRMAKGVYPARYGIYGEIRTQSFAFHFNPTGEIRYIRGLSPSWPHPWEWLKRTWGNDWVYYTVGLDRGQGRIIDWMGENYLPCLSYESNAIRNVNPYTEPGIATAFSAWSQVYGTLCTASLEGVLGEIKTFIESVITHSRDNALIDQTRALHDIIGGRVSVLPPDTRHVDYEVIPVTVADGCLYRCTFCSVKSGMRFKARSRENIDAQLQALKAFYGVNLQNLNALFIGNHDALAAGMETICRTAARACEVFGLDNHPGGTPSLFLFGSAGSFLKTEEDQFDRLAALPFKSYINLGLESFDDTTLKQIGKPISPAMVEDALLKMIRINDIHPNIEITANFILGTSLSDAHHQSLVDLLGGLPKGKGNRGCVYLSPLIETLHREEVLPMFHAIREKSALPAYIYLIQRL